MARINVADKSSPDYAADVPARVKELLGALAPRAIVATSSMDALQGALLVTGAASTVVYFGLPGPEDKLQVPMLEAIQSDRTIRCAWLAPLVWDNVFHAVGAGRIDLGPIVTHTFSLEDAEKGVVFMKESKENKIKGVILFDK